jgi:hypothetical protein
VLLVLGACGEVNDPSQEPQESKAQDIGYNEGDLVTVKVAVPKQTSNRSVSLDTVEYFTNTYEVVFRELELDTNGDVVGPLSPAVYWRGDAKADQGYVDVSVLPNKTYDVLLLAGNNRTLLAAGYSDNSNKGWAIKTGQANIVTIEVTRFPLQWNDTELEIGDTTDFGFSADITAFDSNPAVKVGDRYINLAPVTGTLGAGSVASGDTFTVTFNVGKLAPLYDAQDGDLTIQDYKVRLWPRYEGELFTSVPFKDDEGVGTEVLDGDGDGTGVFGGPYLYSTFSDGSTISFTTDGDLPKEDIDGVLQFDLTYYAFGDKLSKGTAWIIRNGRNATEDSTPSAESKGNTGTGPGSYMVVKFGKGSDPRKESVTINYD